MTTNDPIDEYLSVSPDGETKKGVRPDPARGNTHPHKTDTTIPSHDDVHVGVDPEYPVTPEDPQSVLKQPTMTRLDGNRWVITGVITMAIAVVGLILLYPVFPVLALTGFFITLGFYLISLAIRFRVEPGRNRLYGLTGFVFAMWVTIIGCFIAYLIMV